MNVSFRAKVFVAFTILLGFLLFLNGENPFAHLTVQDFLFFTGLVFLAESLPVFLPKGGAVSVGLAVIFAAFFLFGISAAMWVAAVGVALRFIPGSPSPLYRRAFNASLLAISIWVAGNVYQFIAHDRSIVFDLPHVVAFIASVAVYLVINHTFLSITMGWWTNQSPWQLWTGNLKWLIPNYLALAPLGVLLAISYQLSGIFGLILFIAPLFVARYAFQQYMQMHKIYMATVQALAAAIDAKDHYTKGHSDRVAEYAAAIAREMRLPEDKVEAIHFGALLHDVGKIGVGEAILNKPDKLTNEEFTSIKDHPVIGATILQPITFIKNVPTFVRHHHERYNGKGYPDGLSGEQIPLESRIIAVADVYDAMTTDRPYRKAFSHQEAADYIRQQAGVEFDPHVAEAFYRYWRRTHREGQRDAG